MALTIAIDGPAGAGKTTIAKRLAEALDISYLDTGAMYRALGLKAIREGVDPYDEEAAEALCDRTVVSVEMNGLQQKTLLDGVDISGEIRTNEVGAAASAVSRAKGVRRRMVDLQQQLAKGGIVIEGRDIGTVVLPDATFKFYLVADPRVRAKRRHKEVGGDFDTVLREVIERDEQDMTRAVDPLTRAEDAIEVDTSALDIDGVVDKLLGIIGEGGHER